MVGERSSGEGGKMEGKQKEGRVLHSLELTKTSNVEPFDSSF